LLKLFVKIFERSEVEVRKKEKIEKNIKKKAPEKRGF